MELDGVAILRLGVCLDGVPMRGRPLDPRRPPVRVERPQPHCGGSRSNLLADRHLQRLQMILERESGEKIALNVQISPKVGFGEPQRITSEHRRTDDLRIAKHQCERGLLRA